MSMRFVLAVSLLAFAACTPDQGQAPTSAEPQVVAPTPAAPMLAADEIAAPAGEIVVVTPGIAARVTSPLVVEGSADNTWMFEGILIAKLEVDGQTIAEGAGQQQEPDNWTNPGSVRFKAELPFEVIAATPAVLVLQESMPQPLSDDSDVSGPARTLRIPVVLVPAN